MVEELKQKLPKYEDTFMSYAEELRREGEHKAQLEIAKNLLKSGIDDKIIAKSTKLAQNEIDKLKKSMH